MVDDNANSPRRARRRHRLLTSSAAALTLAAVLTAAAPMAAAVTVQITSVPNGLFPQISCWAFSPGNCIVDPAAVTIPAGTAVTWVNQSGAAHTIVADDGSFSVPVPLNGSGSHVFVAPGTVHYHGEGPYPNLTGTITVTAPPPPPAPPAPPAPHAAGPAAATTVVPAPAAAAPSSASTAQPTPQVDAPGPLVLTPVDPPTPSPAAHRTIATLTSPSSGRSPWFYLVALLIFATVLGVGSLIWRSQYRRPRSLPPAPHPSQVAGIGRPPTSAPAPDHGAWLEL